MLIYTGEYMKKKKKVNKKKFLSRIFIVVIIIIITMIITKSFSKKSEQKFSETIIVNNENITNTLLDKPYINKDNVLYLSLEDIGTIFDDTIYYEEETRKIITTSDTKVAAINVDTNMVELNTANIILSARNF